MATIVIEDGSVVDGANSYSTEDELTTFAEDRGITLSTDASVLLIKSMDYIENQNYKGVKTSSTQDTQWPRTGVVIDGYAVSDDSIPSVLKKAQLTVAIAIDEGNSPYAIVEQAVKSEKVDVIEIEYQTGTTSQSIDPKVQGMLKKLISSGSSYVSFMGRG